MREKYGATIIASAAKGTSANTSATPISVSGYIEANFFLNVTAVSGTSPTLNLTIKTKDPLVDKWHTIATFSEATDVTSEMKSVAANLGTQIAAYYTIGGTNTPTVTFSVSMLAKA
jgi:hypothetical protein